MLKLFTVYELSENMTIGQEKSLQHFDRYLLKLRNGDLPIAALPRSIHIIKIQTTRNTI